MVDRLPSSMLLKQLESIVFGNHVGRLEYPAPKRFTMLPGLLDSERHCAINRRECHNYNKSYIYPS